MKLRTVLPLLCLPLGILLAQSDNVPQNPGPIPFGTVEVVQRSRGVIVYRYNENMADIDPFRDFASARRVTNSDLIRELKELLAQNAEYTPQFTARCLPSWDYGLEFRESPEKRSTFLFSFRCNQMMIYEKKVYRDFSPQSVKFYALLQYEVNDRTSAPLPPAP